MPRVVPSEVREFMVACFEWLGPERTDESVVLGPEARDHAAALLTMIDQVPSELLRLSGRAYAEFVLAVEQMRHAVEYWHHEMSGHKVSTPSASGGRHPLAVIRDALAQCPDTVPSPDVAELAFIEGTQQRDDLRRDLDTVAAPLHSHEWKVATVLSGATVEALLLWAILRKDRASAGALAALVRGLPIKQKAKDNPDPTSIHWGLTEYIEVAVAWGIVESNDPRLLNEIRVARNLIHPAKTEREKMRCGKDTAHAGMAAIERVILRISEKVKSGAL